MAIRIKPSHKGLLHRDLGVPSDKQIPLDKLQAARHSKNPRVRRRAVFASNARKWNRG